MQDAVYASLSSNLGKHWDTGEDEDVPPRTGNRHGGLAECPYNVYPTANGYIAIICVGQAHWQSLTRVMDMPELSQDARFATLQGRVAHMDLIDETVANWTRTRETQALFDQLMAAHVPCAPVRTLEEVINDENMHARGALEWQDHPEYGRIVVQQSPFRFDGVPRFPLKPSQSLGKDTEAILRDWLGMTDADVRAAAGAGANEKPLKV